MATSDELLKEFYGRFGKNGGDQLPSNVGICRTVANVCHELMKVAEPILFDYFAAWDQRAEDERKPYGIEQLLAIARGQWEGAWSLAQVHYDQQLKQEAKVKDRLHKGHPLCNLALVGRAIGSPSLIRHYALLSSAGDLYGEHVEPSRAFGGYAPTMLEQFESRDQQKIYRDRIRNELKSFANSGTHYEDINGRAVSVEWFLDTSIPGHREPTVRWTAYNGELNAYQGELIDKEAYTRHFFATVKRGAKRDWPKLARLWEHLLATCTSPGG